VARRTAKNVAKRAMPIELRSGRVNWPVLKIDV
jgi:hypothetical protein